MFSLSWTESFFLIVLIIVRRRRRRIRMILIAFENENKMKKEKYASSRKAFRSKFSCQCYKHFKANLDWI